MNDKKIIVALDSNNLHDSEILVEELKNQAFAFKIGYEFFLNFGLDGYKAIQNKDSYQTILLKKDFDSCNDLKELIQVIEKKIELLY